MKKRYYQDLIAQANPIKIALLLPVLAWLFLRRGILLVVRVSAEWLYHFELLVFPPAAFASNFYVLSRFFPTHPIRLFALLASSFMSATLTLLLLRPPKKRFPGHWVGL